MAKAKKQSAPSKPEAEEEAPSLRDRAELILFIAVEVLCLILFIDFLFLGIYVK